ncbi:MAG: TraR/DksA C4-type zinc finger protein [Gammaproteobacteria bacterium]
MHEPRNDIDLSRFEGILKRRRKAIVDDISRELEKHEDQRFADLIQQAADPDDRSVADLLVDLNLSELNRDVEELRAIEYALARVRAGSYGICRACGEPIPEERLEAIPETPLCVECQSRAEEARDARTPSL